MIRNHSRTQVCSLVVVVLAFLSWFLLCRSETFGPSRRSFLAASLPSQRQRLIHSHRYSLSQQRHAQQHPTSESTTTSEEILDEGAQDEDYDDQQQQQQVIPLLTKGSLAPSTTRAADHVVATTAAALQLVGGSTASTTSVSSNAWAGYLQRLKVGGYFLLWYTLNIVYNILNKQVLNALPAPLIVGTLQLGVGALYVSLLWNLRLRTSPHLTSTGRNAINQIGVWHSLGQLATMVSLGAGPVSFTHIVKAMEPFFSALVSALVSHKWLPWYVYATLIPVVTGVGYASFKEVNFSWLAFSTAMGSNLFFALRAVFSKIAMTPKKGSGESIGTALTPANVFALVTWSAFLISIPIALIGEGSSFAGLWKKAATTAVKFDGWFSPASWALLRSVALSGFFHYLNNEVMYFALDSVHPVTLAVGNTMKRVFILVASVMFFQNAITLQSGIGSAIGIGGVLLYSLTLEHYTSTQKTRLAGVKA